MPLPLPLPTAAWARMKAARPPRPRPSTQEIISLLQGRLQKQQRASGASRGGGGSARSEGSGRQHARTTTRHPHDRVRQAETEPVNQKPGPSSSSPHVNAINTNNQARRRAAFFLAALVLFCAWAIFSETVLLSDHLSTTGHGDYHSNSIPEEWDPLTADGSPDKVRRRRSPRVSFVGGDMRDKRCWIPADDIQLLGCGMDGMAFGATMACSDFTRRAVSIKVPTSYDNTASPAYAFRTDGKTAFVKRNNIEKIYDALYTNATTTIRQHFAISLGTVYISPNLLLRAVETHKTTSDKHHRQADCYKILSPSSSSESSTAFELNALNSSTLLLATVDEFAKGSRVRLKTLTSQDEQRRLMKDFICIYQHQYERKFIHADILNFYHFFYDGHRVTLVDFGRTLFADDRHREYRQKMQLFQLVALLGNICARSEKKFDVVHATGTGTSMDDDSIDGMRRTLAPALGPCNSTFAEPPLEPLFDGRDFSVARTYQILSNWSGGCSAEGNGTV